MVAFMSYLTNKLGTAGMGYYSRNKAIIAVATHIVTSTVAIL